MKLDLHYTEPRFVAMYETDNPHGPDTDFYIELAAQLETKTILDLGCGTGLLTRALASKGYNITGIDPSSEMIAYGKKQTHGDLVQWVEGTASLLGTPDADLALMTGNVAQVFINDEVWLDTLKSIHAALCKGGHVAFESRNLLARAWESWTPEATREVIDSPYGPLECWLEVIEVSDAKVHFQGHNIFQNTGETLVIDSTLKFRTKHEITEVLEMVGFEIKNIYGGWQQQTMTDTSPVMVFVAQKN